MSDRAGHTFFASWIPDLFVYSSQVRGAARQTAPGDPCGTIKEKETVSFLSDEKPMAKLKRLPCKRIQCMRFRKARKSEKGSTRVR